MTTRPLVGDLASQQWGQIKLLPVQTENIIFLQQQAVYRLISGKVLW